MWTSLSRYLAVAVVLFASLSACGKSSPTAPPPAPCTYTLSESQLSFPASGGSNAVTVTTASQCTWTATSDRGWMSITSGSSGSGGGVVNVSVNPNTTTAERSGTVTIAGLSVAVREDGAVPCTIDIAPPSASFSSGEATGSFAVSAPGGCAWAATSAVTWLRVTSGSPGSGNGTVSYAVERNRDTSSRTSTVAVGERSFTVTQSGEPQPPPPPPVACEYSVTPVEFNPCMSVPGNLIATITTQSGCTWTASPNASWITMTGGESGTGTSVITFHVSDNWDAPRQGIVMVRWPTPTAGQNLHISQAGCRYGVSASSLSFSAVGGTGRFDVLQQSEPLTCGGATQNACRWTAESDVAWITVTTSMPQAGDNPVSFTVAANNETAARVGTIRVRDKVVQITQSGR